MFGEASRRIASLWFPRLASDRALRAHPASGPFALTIQHDNTNRIHCLNIDAERRGLQPGMAVSDARAFCPDLQSRPADLPADRRFLRGLRHWATQYCPWVGLEDDSGLVLDITGSAHLFGGEAALLDSIGQRMARAGLTVRMGLGDTRGAAWAMAHHGEGIIPPGQPLAMLGRLPVAALRLDGQTIAALQRLGLRNIGQLVATPRAPLARRFGPGLLRRLDQALGAVPEQIAPAPDPPHYGLRISLPDPIGLEADVMAGTARLLERLCRKLAAEGRGARVLELTLCRVDQRAERVTLRLARAMRDPAQILPLFARGIGAADAGFGIDQMRLAATQVEPLAAEQIGTADSARQDRLDDLITRIGARIGIGNIRRLHPADSHIPEHSFTLAPVAYSRPMPFPAPTHPRPLILFPPEAITGISTGTGTGISTGISTGTEPPQAFRWRRMALTTGRATGPERIAPQWWHDDPNWRSGLRDYWRVETAQGRRLWLFHTPQNPGWFVQGEFA